MPFGDHPRRPFHHHGKDGAMSRSLLSYVTVSEYQPDYRAARQYHTHQPPLFTDPGPARRTNAPQYFEERIWYQGPHAEERRAFEEQGRELHPYGEDRQEPREPRRSRRFTRFSPPNSPGNGLDLVPLPRRHSLSGRPSHPGGNETGSDATATNADGPAANTMNLRRPTPAQGNNARGEGSSAPRGPKFFANLRRTSFNVCVLHSLMRALRLRDAGRAGLGSRVRKRGRHLAPYILFSRMNEMCAH